MEMKNEKYLNYFYLLGSEENSGELSNLDTKGQYKGALNNINLNWKPKKIISTYR
jgi:hypothetical protein